MQKDEFACRECYSVTKTLNVHHLVYMPGKEVWEYPDEHLITLCEGCHETQRHINLKKSFADGGFIEARVEMLAYVLKLVAPNYVNTPRANNQALWTITHNLLEENKIDFHDFLKGYAAYVKKRNG